MGKQKNERLARERAESEAKEAEANEEKHDHKPGEYCGDCKTNPQMGNWGYTGYTGVVNSHLAARVDSQSSQES